MADHDDKADGEHAEASFGLKDGLRIVKRRWRLIVAMAVLAAIGAALVAKVLPNRYEAAAVVVIDPRRKTIVNVEEVVGDLKVDTTAIESEVEIIRSKEIVLQVIDQLDLRTDSEFHGPTLVQSLLATLGLGKGPDIAAPAPVAGDPTLVRDEIAAAFLDRLKVARVRNTYLIEVRFSGRDPVKAARIANTLVEVYVKEQLLAKTRAAESASGLLSQKLQGLRHDVYEAERRVEQFKADNSIFDAEGQLLSEKQLARAMEQTINARTSTAETLAKYDQVRRMIGAGDSREAIADVLQSHSVRTLKENFAKVTRREAKLATKYGPRHPEMLKIQAERADAQQQLAREIDQIVANLKTEYEVATSREQSLQVALGRLKDGQIKAKEAAVRLKELEREAATSKALFEAFLARYKQTLETHGLQHADARIGERATVPLRPASPKRAQIVVGATVAGIAIGLALALFLELGAPGLRRPEDVERALEQEHLASLPEMGAGGRPLDALRAARLMIAEPDGTFAEAVRGLRHAIDTRRHGPGPRVILLASSLPDEGKSLVASNLAHHLAVSGVRTILIDADMRRASLTKALAPDRNGGLLEHLSGEAALRDVALSDTTTGLVFIPASRILTSTPPAAELVTRPAFARLIEGLKRQADVIVIDAPPLLPVVDARIIADVADQIVMVATWRRTPKEMVRRALRTLGQNAGKVVGVVLNKVAPDELPSYHAIEAERPRGTDRRAA